MKKILIATAVVVLPLAGCGQATTDNQNTQPAGQQEQSHKTQAPVVNADTMLDQRIFGEATRGDDASKCDAIVDEEMKTECGQIVNAGLLSKDAIEKRDKGVCDGIKLERYKEQCEVGVDEKVKEDEKIQEREDSAKKIYDISKEAMDKKDYKLCNAIADNNSKNACKFNVIANSPELKENDSLCDEIGDEDLVKKCKNQTLSN